MLDVGVDLREVQVATRYARARHLREGLIRPLS
jgi:hypothetical protein